VLTDCLRPEDAAARLGGDEFVLWLSNVRADEAHAITCRVLATLEHESAARAWGISASIGVVPVVSSRLSLTDLLAVADAAMYSAKRGGRGRVVVASEADARGALTNAV
jgi:diguanylate cyclase (GGDEF)-like protein